MQKYIAFFFCAVVTLTARAELVTKSVTYEQAGVKLVGYLSYDDVESKTRRPGVLVVPEWWGLNNYVKGRADQLAKMGYVAFAVDMYGEGAVTMDPKKAQELAGPFYGKPAMAERAQAGLDQLLKTGLVDEKKVAAIGFCFGGTTCQALAYSGAPLLGIVSFHGGPIPASPEAAAKNKAKFLICHGAIDPFVKPEDFAAFKASLDQGKFDYEINIYAGAMHAFTNPDADKISAQTGLKGIGYNEPAARRSWLAMQNFFDEIFGSKL